jgi:hypothetical protein
VTIDEYLRELERRLPRLERRRFLAEAETHLCQRAADLVAGGLRRDEAETRAVLHFGPPEAVALSAAAAGAPRAIRLACAAALLGLGALVVPLYGIPENVLPPAHWDERPTHLGVLLGVALASWLLSLALAVGALVLSSTGWSKAAASVLWMAAAAGAACIATGLAAAVAWRFAAPTTPLATLLILVSTAAAPALGLVVGAAAYARGARTRLLYAFETSR